MKIDITKKYQTRDGRDVTLLHRAPDGWPTKWPWRGMISGESVTWTDEGHHIRGGNDDWNLIEVREPREFELAINLENPNCVYSRSIGGLKDNPEWEIIRVREIL